MSAIHGWYPASDEGRALLLRHRQFIQELERGDVYHHEAIYDDDGVLVRPAFQPWDALLLVTHPKRELLEASLRAVRERELVAA